MTTVLNSTVWLKDFLVSEARGNRSRDEILVTQTGARLESGTLLSQVDTATSGAATAVAGNTGNGTFGSITVADPALVGTYNVTFTAATKFDVEDPDGVKVGSGTTGSAFSKKGVGFTITAGGTAFVAGDAFTIAVGAGTGKYVAYAAQTGPIAILYEALGPKTGDSKAVGFKRDCEVSRAQLTGLDAAAEKQLALQGVIVRGKYTTP